MRLLLSGATGFIGSRLAVRARALGHEVRAMGLANGPAEAENRRLLQAKGIEVAAIPLGGALPPDLARDIDVVIHLAAAQHEMNVPDGHFHAVNVGGTQDLFEAARAAGAGRFVYGSSIGVYGNAGERIDGATPPRPNNAYGASKLEAERWLLAQNGGPEVVVVRIGETYGPGDRRLLKLFKGVARGRFPILGGGENLHQPIYVDDLVRGLLAAAESATVPDRPVVMAGPEPLTTKAMLAAVAASVGRPVPSLRLPLGPFVGGAALCELTLRPLGIQPPLHRRRLDFFQKSLCFVLDDTREALRFEPEVRFPEGAVATAAWYRDQGLLAPAGAA